MARRFQRTVRRFRRAKKELIWVRAEIFQAVAGNGDLTENAVVTPSDWARVPTTTLGIEKGCVLLRQIVHWEVSWVPDDSPAAAVNDSQGYVTMRKVDQDDNATLNAGVDLFNEDWMRMDSYNIQQVFAVVATLTWADRAHAMQRGMWDSKLKRKLTSDDEVRMGVAASAIVGLPVPSLHAFVSTLLQLP